MTAYVDILGVPRVAALLAATTLSRLPAGLNALAVLLVVRDATGSFAAAGLATAAMTAGGAIGAPAQGRMLDRRGWRLLVPIGLGHAGALALLVLLADVAAGTGALAGAAFLAGLTLPSTAAVLRSLWPTLLRGRPELVSSAYALDWVIVELIFVAGPLLTAVAAAAADPAAAVWLSAALAAVGTCAVVAVLPGSRPGAMGGAGAPLAGTRGLPGIGSVVLATFPVGFCFGALEVALPAFARGEGTARTAGVLLAVWAAGSAIGGLVYGAVARRPRVPELHLALALALPLGYLPLALAASPGAMAGMLLAAGLLTAPLLATRNELVAGLAPPRRRAEAFGWPMSALVSGTAAGAAAGGALVEGSGWSAGLLAGGVAAAVGGVVVLARRRALVPDDVERRAHASSGPPHTPARSAPSPARPDPVGPPPPAPAGRAAARPADPRT
jgi:MFS family permease